MVRSPYPCRLSRANAPAATVIPAVAADTRRQERSLCITRLRARANISKHMRPRGVSQRATAGSPPRLREPAGTASVVADLRDGSRCRSRTLEQALGMRVVFRRDAQGDAAQLADLLRRRYRRHGHPGAV